jgi:hypothetical protein
LQKQWESVARRASVRLDASFGLRLSRRGENVQRWLGRARAKVCHSNPPFLGLARRIRQFGMVKMAFPSRSRRLAFGQRPNTRRRPVPLAKQNPARLTLGDRLSRGAGWRRA